MILVMKIRATSASNVRSFSFLGSIRYIIFFCFPILSFSATPLDEFAKQSWARGDGSCSLGRNGGVWAVMEKDWVEDLRGYFFVLCV